MRRAAARSSGCRAACHLRLQQTCWWRWQLGRPAARQAAALPATLVAKRPQRCSPCLAAHRWRGVMAGRWGGWWRWWSGGSWSQVCTCWLRCLLVGCSMWQLSGCGRMCASTLTSMPLPTQLCCRRCLAGQPGGPAGTRPRPAGALGPRNTVHVIGRTAPLADGCRWPSCPGQPVGTVAALPGGAGGRGAWQVPCASACMAVVASRHAPHWAVVRRSMPQPAQAVNLSHQSHLALCTGRRRWRLMRRR